MTKMAPRPARRGVLRARGAVTQGHRVGRRAGWSGGVDRWTVPPGRPGRAKASRADRGQTGRRSRICRPARPRAAKERW